MIDASRSIKACAAYYGDNADAMESYLKEGEKKALELGADLIVIGRPITEAKKPLDEIRKINILLG